MPSWCHGGFVLPISADLLDVTTIDVLVIVFMSTNSAEEHPPLGDLAFQILLALGTGPSHGYAIGLEIEERTEGRVRPTTGALYQALKRLRDDGLVAPDDDAAADSPDARRKYFRLTELGRAVTAAEARRLDALVATARARHLFERS
jgi:DNA-binding PadR family transcriptional regulator